MEVFLQLHINFLSQIPVSLQKMEVSLLQTLGRCFPLRYTRVQSRILQSRNFMTVID